MSLDNANASEGEKKAASKIGAAFIGKKARSDMHNDIMKNGTQEQKDALNHLETKRQDKRNLKKKRRIKKRKTRDPNETVEMRIARKKRQLKKRQTRKVQKKKAEKKQ